MFSLAAPNGIYSQERTPGIAALRFNMQDWLQTTAQKCKCALKTRFQVYGVKVTEPWLALQLRLWWNLRVWQTFGVLYAAQVIVSKTEHTTQEKSKMAHFRGVSATFSKDPPLHEFCLLFRDIHEDQSCTSEEVSSMGAIKHMAGHLQGEKHLAESPAICGNKSLRFKRIPHQKQRRGEEKELLQLLWPPNDFINTQSLEATLCRYTSCFQHILFM